MPIYKEKINFKIVTDIEEFTLIWVN